MIDHSILFSLLQLEWLSCNHDIRVGVHLTIGNPQALVCDKGTVGFPPQGKVKACC
ncbi:MAG: hypothetical protein RMK91_11010 [Pseudanabaenaceae cyanobacterium SKYGB_i_bin29]|nr:hypothetical protein [Pseudanabaenaceae cyanobacterium SKYGB_i_bin29]